MKRKLIPQKTAYTITLPIDWIRENNLSNSDEVNLSVENNNLIISTEKKSKLNFISIDLKDTANAYSRIMIENPYLKGFDVIQLNYLNSLQLDIIQDVVSNLIGVEIVEQSKNYCKISQTARPTKDEFKTILRRVFNIIKYTNNLIVDDLDYGIFNNFSKIDKQTKDVRRFLLFCTRTLHKLNLTSRKDESFYHLLLERLILIQHNQYYLYFKIHTKIGSKRLNINQKVIINLKLSFEMFDIFKDMFFKKDFSNFKKINIYWNELYFNKTQELFLNCNFEESVIIYHTMYLSKLIFLISQPSEVLVKLI